MLDRVPHLAGETKGKTLTGGHLYTAMKTTFADVQFDSLPQNGKVWSANWLTGKFKHKKSTFFPAEWTEKILTDELKGSTKHGKYLRLKGGIIVELKGDTFFPLMDEE
jgi:predicted P-loop ATPase